MDKLKKVLGFLVFPLLLLLMFFPTGEAQAADVTDKAHVDKYEITIASTGSKTEGIHGSNDTSMKLKYSGKFSFPNVAANEIKDGDYFIVKAPDNLSLTDGSLDLIDSTSNIKMGTVQVDNANHRLVFTFNDKVKDKQNIRGDFVAEATETLQKEGKTVTYVLPDGKTQTITYKVNTYQKTDVIGETITKYGYNDNNKAIAHFQMKINRAKEDMTGHVVKITDDVSKGAFANYVEGTFYMYEAEFETTNTNSSALKHLGDKYEITTDPEVYKANSDKKALLTFVNGKRGFELLMPTNMGRKSFFLTYDTSSPADTSTISNSAQYLIDNQPQLIWKKYGGSTGTRTEATFNLKTVKSVGASVTADIAGKIKITKYDEADATVKLAGVVFEILRKSDRVKVQEITTDANGVALSESLVDGEYIVKEKTPKSGYLAISKEFEVELKAGKGVPLNISNKRETVDFEATKTWVGGKKTDYKEVKLGLYVHKKGQTVADSKPVSGNYTPEVTESNGVYTYKWKNQLPKYDVDGTTELVYSVRELEDQTNLPLAETETVAGGTSDYVVSYNEDKTKITNTYKPAKISVTAKKVWSGGQETVRPTVYFKLYRTPEGGAIEEVAGAAQKEVPKTDGTVEWTDLPATDEHGVKYTYSVMEVDEDGNLVTTVDGYTASQTAGLTVTNTYSTSQTKADIKVKKELTGGRPTPLQNEEFEFILKDKNGQEVQRAKNDANGDVVFKDIPFTQEGHYQYTIVEANAGQTIDGVTHDARTVRVTVHVYDNGKGQLVAWVENFDISSVAIPAADFASSAPGSALVPPISGAINTITDAGIQTFKNTYKATNAKAVLEVTKQLTGRATGAQENEFEFTLTDQAGNVETKKNDAAGKVKFDELTFDEAGTYTYTIKEVKAGTTENGITYDSKTITAKVTVTDDGHGKLTAVVDYSSDGTANSTTFTNTYNPAKVKAPVSATKSFINKNTNTPMPLKGGEFVFSLLNHEGDPVEKTTNDADGNIKFKDLEFEKAGTYQYTIYEHKAGQIENGITYSNKTVEVTIEVTDDGHGALKATVSYDNDEKHFENTYKAANAKANLEVTKKLTGRDTEAQDGEFEFTLTDSTGVVKDTKKNDAAGNVKFDELEFDKVGTYTYTIKEVKAGQTENGITYDSKTVTAKVTVTDDGKGNLTAVVDYSSDGTANSTTFTNVYTPAGATTVTLGAKKVLEGKALEAGKYSFVLKKEDGSVVETVTNAADGSVTFSPISYDESQVGTHKYTISEVEGSEAGITYDKTVQEVEVKVEKVSSTELKATVSKEAKDLVFTNKYTPAGATTVTLGAKKVLEGKTLEAGKYSFELKKEDGSVVETVKNAADGTVTFSPISYDESQVGTHKYTISEVAGSETGITYDKTVHEVEVTVKKVSATELKATASKEAKDLVFKNIYTPAGATTVTLGAKKVLEGKALEAGKYSFVLKKEDGSVVETVTNAADGTVTFSPISYDESQVGTHKYTISEVEGSEAGITYDKTVQEVEVKVEKVSSTELKATVSKEAKDLVFTNKYTPAGATTVTLGAKKVLEGKALEAGKYSFVLKKEDGSVVETVTNAADGSVTFSPISYDESQVGTHKYTISEVAGSEAGITYDKTVQEVEVTVEKVNATELKATASKEAKDLVFTNKYTPAGATSVTLGAKKVLEGKTLEAGKYSFELKKEDGSVVETVKNAADGTVTFSPISYDESQVGTHKYTISEVAGSETGITYDKTVHEVEVTVKKVSATELKATASKEAKDLVFTNKYTPRKTQIPVKKVWKDADNQDGKRPASVTVKLLADGQDTGKTLELNAANGWAGSFTDLDADKGGTAIQYTVVEVTVPGYTSEVTGDAASGFTITNSYSPETVDIKATKNWDDANNQDGKRPTKITINLLADGQKVDSKEIQAAPDGTWSVEFTKLAKYKNGKEIKYTVTEEAVAEYDSYIKDFTITNKYTPKAIDYKVTKVWNDANDQDGKRPESVTVQLYKKVGDADPVAVEGKKLTLTAKDKTDANTWVASFTKLPQYEAGKEITYSIKEVDVPAGYKASVTGQVVTNTHNPDTVILSGTKVWNDNNNQSGKRADKVKVQIFKGEGEKAELVQEIEVSEATGWKFESKALPKYENGKEIKYTVKEVAVKEYTSTVTTDKDGKYTVTNEYTPEKTSVKGKKIWNDANNKDGIRPDSIKVKLLADGKETGKEATASEATGWTYEFTELERYKDTKGTEFKYSVVEVPVKGYTSEVEGFNITNTHTPEEPTPGEPNEPQDPEPNKPKDPEPGKPGPKPQLPNTGEKASNAAVVAGLALMAVTGGLYFVSRKNK